MTVQHTTAPTEDKEVVFLLTLLPIGITAHVIVRLHSSDTFQMLCVLLQVTLSKCFVVKGMS